MKHVAVVGAGIAGLAAAYELHRSGARVTVYEAGPQPGGVIRTELADGYLIEGGPDSFLTTKPGAVELVRALDLEERVIRPLSRRVYVFSGGELHPLPEGLYLTVPTRLGALATSRLFTWRGKLRMAMDLVLPRGPESEDESLGSFVRRRLGREAFDKLAEPIMAGIYMSGGDDLSMRATFPRFLNLERDHRSLIRGLRRARVAQAPVSPFASLRSGMRELVDRLVAAMPRVEIRTGLPVRRLERGWRIAHDRGTDAADAVILAVPAPAAAALVRPLDPTLAELLNGIPYVGSATVSLGFSNPPVVPDGTGFVIPRAERRTILACTWSSSKFEGRAPPGKALFRCFVTGDPLEMPDDRLIAVVRDDLRRLMGCDENPELARVYRWPNANPIYRVGHAAQVREIEARLADHPGLHLAGAAYRGIGVPDSISDGRNAARRAAPAPASEQAAR